MSNYIYMIIDWHSWISSAISFIFNCADFVHMLMLSDSREKILSAFLVQKFFLNSHHDVVCPITLYFQKHEIVHLFEAKLTLSCSQLHLQSERPQPNLKHLCSWLCALVESLADGQREGDLNEVGWRIFLVLVREFLSLKEDLMPRTVFVEEEFGLMEAENLDDVWLYFHNPLIMIRQV